MAKRFRLILSLLTIIAFLILAPVLVMYAMGYRFGKEIKTVGMIYLRSTPKDANIYINGKPFKENTPAAITSLQSKEYQMKVIKEGFSSWEKKIKVFPNTITEVRNIYLLPIFLSPRLITEHSVDYYKLSPSQESIAYITGEEKNRGIWALNLKNLSKVQIFSKLIHKDLEVPESLEWSPDSKRIIFLAEPELKRSRETLPRYFIVDIEKPTEIIDLSSLTPFPELDEPRWVPNGSNKIFYTLKNKDKNFLGVFELNLDNGENKQILPDNVITYAYSNNEIYFIKKDSKDASKIELWKANIDGGNPVSVFSFSELKSDYRALLSTENNIIIFTPEDKKIYLLNPVTNQLEVAASNITDVKWSPNGKYILYLKDGHEIWVYNFNNEKSVFLKKGQDMLLGKYADSIQEVAWFSTSEHILFKTNNEIKLTEVDNRGGTNVNKIGISNSPLNFNLGKNGEIIYLVNHVEDDIQKIYEIFLTKKGNNQEIIR